MKCTRHWSDRMNAEQMEKLVSGIRESERNNRSLAEVLLQFNESFNDFMIRLTDVAQIKELHQTYENIESFKETIEGIKEDIELTHTAQMGRMNHLKQELKQEMSEVLHNSVQSGISKGIKEELRQSKLSIALQDKIYVVSDGRRSIVCYDEMLKNPKVVYEGNGLIKNLIYIGSKLLIHHENGRLCTLARREVLNTNSLEVLGVSKGLIILSDTQDLLYYSIETEEVTVIANKVQAFEVIGNNKLLYQLQDNKLQVYNIKL